MVISRVVKWRNTSSKEGNLPARAHIDRGSSGKFKGGVLGVLFDGS